MRNWLNNTIYKATGKGISGMEMKKRLPLLKQEPQTAWLKQTYSQCLQQAVLNFSTALVNFFEKRAGYPRFKSKQGKQSLQYPQNVKIEGNRLKFPMLGLIKAKIHRRFEGKIKTVTITQTRTRKYYASIARQDFLHKLSRKIVNENQVIIAENLNISRSELAKL